MKTIWKYEIETVGRQTLLLPADAEMLAVQVQISTPCLWVLSNTGEAQEIGELHQTISTYGTGQNMPEDPGKYIGTYQLREGELVFHVFADSNTQEHN